MKKIIWIQRKEKTSGNTLYQRQRWLAIIPELEVEGCEYIDKPTFGWLNWSGFGEHDEIELVGVCTDICVVSNALIFEGHVSRCGDFGRCRLLCRVTPEKNMRRHWRQ